MRLSSKISYVLVFSALGCSSTLVTGPGQDAGADVTSNETAVADVPRADVPAVDVPSSDAVAPTDTPAADAGELPRFSFFVTSLTALRALSMSQSGFGGDLRFGETGPGAGLRGADRICTAIAERSMPGSGAKQWHAFLSATDEGSGQVNAIDRIGAGPWYDRIGRLLANNRAELLMDRPLNAHAAIRNDFPNEDGVPNHQPDSTQGLVDNHDMLTGTNAQGQLYSATATCRNWTSALGMPATEGRPRVGHSWPRSGGGPGPGGRDGGMMGGINSNNWMSALDEAGCAPGVSLIEMGPPNPSIPTVGSGGGYGGFYCFAMMP